MVVPVGTAPRFEASVRLVMTEPSTYRITEDQAALRDAVRVLADEQIAPRAADIDRSGEFPWDVKELLASHDILSLPYPEAYGGLGGDLLTVCLAVEQISRVCATSGLILAVQELASLPLLLAGTDAQRDGWFPDLAAGRKLIAFALTEAEAGSRRRPSASPRVLSSSPRRMPASGRSSAARSRSSR